ncbi:hypothetical protein BDV97DRAFT_398387 [Delphinella strobiligena]|nr:hypothetical protein BDV97DRAFT_398387 [Delphinella strobiligena]
MGQKDSRIARGADSHHYNNTNDTDHFPHPPAPKETIESLMRNLTTLIPLFPDEAILLEDSKAGRIHFNVSSEFAAVMMNNLPQNKHAKLKNASYKAIQRVKHDLETPVSCRPTPDRPYRVLLVSLKDMLLRWKDMSRDGDGDDADEDKPDDLPSCPPPPYTFFPPIQQNGHVEQQGRTANCTTRSGHTSSQPTPKKPTLKQPPSAQHRAPATVACNTRRPSLIPYVVNEDKVSGGRHTAMTKSAQLFESKLQLRFPDQPELGYFATTPRIVNGDLHLWTECRIRASTTTELHAILASSRPTTWLRPCRHLGASAYRRIPLRDDDLSYRDFMAHSQRYGALAACEEIRDTKQNQRTVVSCQYCYTDYNIRMWKQESKDAMSFKTVTAYCLDIDVWHNLGAGFDAMESKWLGFAAAASFTTLKVVPLERGLGSVAKVYQY